MKYFRFSILILAVIALLNQGCMEGTRGLPPPNIVWITSEDNSKHYMQLFDEHGIETPAIGRLAEHGIVFTHAFSNAPVCSAARSTLISGVYGPRMASHYHRKVQMVNLPDGLEMFPTYLGKAGYYTTNNRKEDYNIVKGDSVWNESSGKASWRNRQEGQPFFHVQNFTTTHEGQLFFPLTQLEIPDTLSDRNNCFIHPYHPDTELFAYTNARYRDKIATMDRQVGDLLKELEQDGLLENTFIFYFGDHGGVLPGSKGYLNEVGLHVPLVVYIPPAYESLVHAKPGSIEEAFVSFVDFGATVLNLAGLELPEGIDGRPFLGQGINDLDDRQVTFAYADRFDEKYEMVRSVRKGDLKYIRYFQPFIHDGLWNDYRYRQAGYMQWLEMFRAGELDEIQSAFFRPKSPEALYDLSADPYETRNLASDPEWQDELREMRADLKEWMLGVNDLSLFPEHYLAGHAFDNPVAFGLKEGPKIRDYLEVADLMLLDYADADVGIVAALESEDPWIRYWGLSTCSSFGLKASLMLHKVKGMSASDPELINRVRAAEYLGITGLSAPHEPILNSLYGSGDAVEVLLMLNSVVMLQDGYSYEFEIDESRMDPQVKEDVQVKRRLEYLLGK